MVLATLAMLVRNAVILGLLAPGALLNSVIPLGLMLACTSIIVVLARRADGAALKRGEKPTEPVPAMQSPFSLTAALTFGVIFLGLQIAGTLAQRALGTVGFYGVSVAGGMVSSASAVAAAGSLAAAARLPLHVAGTGAIIASLVSAAVNLPIVARLGGDRALTRRLAWTLSGIVMLGVVGTLIQAHMADWLLLPLAP